MKPVDKNGTTKKKTICRSDDKHKEPQKDK